MPRGFNSRAHNSARTDQIIAERICRAFRGVFCICLVLFSFVRPASAEVLSIDENGAIHTLCALGAPPARVPAKAPVPAAYRQAMENAATHFAISTDLLDTVARAESGYNADAISPKGAIGIMQLMPGTAKILGVDPHDPTQNIRGGAAYLRYLLDTFNGRIDYALGAYNAGQNAIIRYGALPPYPETRAYVSQSLAWLAHISDEGPITPSRPTCQ